MTVYVIGSARGPKKIGISSNAKRRCAQLSDGGPREYRLLHARQVPAATARLIEGHALHLVGASKIRGEWFKGSLRQAKAAVDAAVALGGAGEQVKRAVGRKLRYPDKIIAPLPPGSLARIEAVLADGEDKTDFLREAVEDALTRREASPLRTRSPTPSPRTKKGEGE